MRTIGARCAWLEMPCVVRLLKTPSGSIDCYDWIVCHTSPSAARRCRGPVPPKLSVIGRKVVTQTFASWNRIADWLRRLDGFRRAARGANVVRAARA